MMNHTNNSSNEISNVSMIEPSQTLIVMDELHTDSNSIEPINGMTPPDTNFLIPVVISPNPENSSSHSGKLDSAGDSGVFNAFDQNFLKGKEVSRKSLNTNSECVKSDAVVIISEKGQKETGQMKEVPNQLDKIITSEEKTVSTNIGLSNERKPNSVVHKQLPIRGKNKNTVYGCFEKISQMWLKIVEWHSSLPKAIQTILKFLFIASIVYVIIALIELIAFCIKTDSEGKMKVINCIEYHYLYWIRILPVKEVVFGSRTCSLIKPGFKLKCMFFSIFPSL